MILINHQSKPRSNRCQGYSPFFFKLDLTPAPLAAHSGRASSVCQKRERSRASSPSRRRGVGAAGRAAIPAPLRVTASNAALPPPLRRTRRRRRRRRRRRVFSISMVKAPIVQNKQRRINLSGRHFTGALFFVRRN